MKNETKIFRILKNGKTFVRDVPRSLMNTSSKRKGV